MNKKKKEYDEYISWRRILNYCYPKSVTTSYEQKGIKVCETWRGKDGFWTFLEDVGTKPYKNSKLSRRNKFKDFNKENCFWTKEQTKRSDKIVIFFKGQEKTLSNWCKELSISYGTAYSRYKRELSAEEIFYPGRLNEIRFKHENKEFTLSQFCKKYKLSKTMVYYRHIAGWSTEEIINEPNQHKSSTRKDNNLFYRDEERIARGKKLRKLRELDSYKEYIRYYDKRF